MGLFHVALFEIILRIVYVGLMRKVPLSGNSILYDIINKAIISLLRNKRVVFLQGPCIFYRCGRLGHTVLETHPAALIMNF